MFSKRVIRVDTRWRSQDNSIQNLVSIRASGTRIRQMLFTASTDFVHRSLSKVDTIVGKLLYCATLRDRRSDEYIHWGLTKQYGHEEVQTAIAAHHREILYEWLTSRCSELVDDFSGFTAAKELSSGEALQRISGLCRFLPPNGEPDLALHCSLHCETLQELVSSLDSRAA
jgi:hypothetical protein